jgi:hypothetical protein
VKKLNNEQGIVKITEYLLLLHSFRIFMSRLRVLYRPVLVFLLLLISIQAVSAWNVQDLVIKPSAGPISPQTLVTVTCVVHFDSWMTGLTFPSGSTLDMYTDLTNAQWVVTLTDYERDPPETSPLLERKGAQVRIDSWDLSFPHRQLDLNVWVKGSAPDVYQTQEKIMIRVQERDSTGNALSETAMTRKNTIFVATPTPTPPPPSSTQMTTDIVQTQNTPVTSVAPTKKPTYTPGPEPFLICGTLALLVIIVAKKRKK